MGDFLRRTKDLITRMDELSASTSGAEWELGYAELLPILNDWNASFATLSSPTAEEYDAIVEYTTKYTQMLMMRFQSAPAAGGKRRKYTRRYCKRTPCRKMGFTQKASCRPYKNCYLTGA